MLKSSNTKLTNAYYIFCTVAGICGAILVPIITLLGIPHPVYINPMPEGMLITAMVSLGLFLSAAYSFSQLKLKRAEQSAVTSSAS